MISWRHNSQIMCNVVQIKTIYQHFSAQICLLCFFHTYLTSSIPISVTQLNAWLAAHGESHLQHNANREVATTSPPFYNEPH